MHSFLAPPTALYNLQPITDGTNLPLITQKNASIDNPELIQHFAGSPSVLPSYLQHQTQCIHTIHKTIRHLRLHLKAEQLNGKTFQIIALQLLNDFALLRYLLFSSVGTIPNSVNSVDNPTISPTATFNRNPKPNPTSTALTVALRCGPLACRFTPEGAVGPPTGKRTISANADFQSSPNTQAATRTATQNITSRISELENVFADKTAT